MKNLKEVAEKLLWSLNCFDPETSKAQSVGEDIGKIVKVLEEVSK